MYIKKRGALVILAMAAALMVVFAASWDGNAIMGSYGDFPASGYYAACNSFPRNSSVEVTNLENGRSVTVLVTRGLDSPGVFMMLSVDAANALGVGSGRVVRVRAAEPKSALELSPSGSGRASDPDFNPKLLAQEELRRLGYQLELPAQPLPVSPAPASSAEPPAAAALPSASAPQAAAVAAPSPASAAPAAAPVVDARPAAQPAASAALAALPESPSPPAAASEAPELVNGKKPKPVRTLYLPQLPEPGVPPLIAKPAPTEAPAALSAAPASPAGPEVLSMALPQPDETPIRVAPAAVPKRYEAPAFLPDYYAGRQANKPSPAPELSLAEPSLEGAALAGPLADESPEALVGVKPSGLGVAATAPLAAPSAPADAAIKAAERAEAFARAHPSMAPGAQGPALAWPELEADEIPDAILARVASPRPDVPSTSLAEGELRIEDPSAPVAIAKTTPTLDAAETRVALAEAEGQKPEALAEKPQVQAAAPADTIIALEPSSPRPPESAPSQAPAASAAPVSVTPPAASAAAAPIAAAPAAAPARAEEKAPVPGLLAKGKFYIQVAAYRSLSGAQDAGSSLQRSGHVIVIEPGSDKGGSLWRVYVGPLSRDESGVALVRVRSLGFKDAFLKQGI
jgi:cell division septation protein DedD/rare lipoprotein A (peptidoglycan hydrolase)